MEFIYPLTVVLDRYNGVYSGGIYTAWNRDFDEIPSTVSGSDVPCMCFWMDTTEIVGRGNTMEEAVRDLERRLHAHKKGR